MEKSDNNKDLFIELVKSIIVNKKLIILLSRYLVLKKRLIYNKE